MEEMLSSKYIFYHIGVIWIIIASIVAYFNTKKEIGTFKILKFLELAYNYTIGVVIFFLEKSNTRDKSDTIKSVRFQNGYANITTKNRSHFSIKCDELIGWTEQLVTVRIYNGRQKIIKSINARNKIVDSYFE